MRASRRPNSPSWDRAKADGDAGEHDLSEWFHARGWDVFRAVGRADANLVVHGTLEVKHDLRAETSGNVAVETACGTRPSGIMTSRATLWAFVVGREALLIPTDALRRFALSGRFPERRGGDGGRSRFRLVPLEALRGEPGVRVVRLGEVAE